MRAAPSAFRVFVPTLDESYDDAGFGPVEPLAEALPLPGDLGEDKILVVLAGDDAPVAPRGNLLGNVLGRVFGRLRKRTGVHRAVRGAALLARGYADVSGGTFGEHVDAVWGFTAPARRG